MFRRRNPLKPHQILREIFWPSMGWRRSFKYVKHRILRLSDSSRRIAAGLAIGASISFTPLVGTHFIQAGFIAYLMRANLLAALIGTFTGNPWTFPFMWWGAIRYGAFLFELLGLPASTALPEEVNMSVLWELITEEPLRIFLPWLLGGYCIAILIWPFAYFVFLRLIRTAKAAQTRARIRKVHKVAREMTDPKE